MTKERIIETVTPILEKYPVKRAGLFGSYARGEQNEDSDIDILLEFSESIGLGYGSMYLDLMEVVPIPTGLLTSAGLAEQSQHFQESVRRNLEVFFER
ncbi:MAG: nucleotidyltransferase domain-containing protein [Turicibacter sp.]|nr:nucleotidyltransferase domain-containing protein [Turicibacter sp.]